MDKLVIGCGYLGRRVAALWREQGHRVFATSRNPGRADELRRSGLEPVICDVLNPATLTALPRVESVFYGIGFDRGAGRSMREVYVDGLANVLACLPWAKRLIYISSTGVYGQSQGEEVDENAATEPEEESGRVVLDAERLLRDRLPGAVVLRFAGIYGPGRLLRQQALLAGEPLAGDAAKWLNLIHVEDGAAAVVAAETCAVLGAVYNVCDDCPVRRRDFYTRLAELLGAPEPRFTAPAPGPAPPPHERANRRVRNQRMQRQFGVQLRYPTYHEGLAAATSPARPPPAAPEAAPGRPR